LNLTSWTHDSFALSATAQVEVSSLIDATMSTDDNSITKVF
jgi:hypothetical protein